MYLGPIDELAQTKHHSRTEQRRSKETKLNLQAGENHRYLFRIREPRRKDPLSRSRKLSRHGNVHRTTLESLSKSSGAGCCEARRQSRQRTKPSSVAEMIEQTKEAAKSTF